MSVKTNRESISETASRPDGAGSVLIGRPTVAGNAGADVPPKLLREFLASDLSFAEWIRLPSPRARCRLTGLSRTSLNELAERGVIRAITVRQPGALRGIKLLNRASLLAYLRRLEVEQCGDSRPEGGPL